MCNKTMMMMMKFENLKAIRYKSTNLTRIVADKSNHVTVA